MTTAVIVIADWIKRIVDVERTRDAVRDRHEETAAREAALVRLHGGRLLDEMRAAILRDVNAFQSEFTGAHAREVTVTAGDIAGSLMIRKPAAPAVSLAVAPDLDTATIACHYSFSPPNGLPSREDHLELTFVVNEEGTVQVRHPKTAETFGTADALSEFLLVPVLTGRPR